MPLARAQLRAPGGPPGQLVFVDGAPRGAWRTGPRLMSYADFLSWPAARRYVAIAIANSHTRQKLAQRCQADKLEFWSVQAENAFIMDDVQIGEGASLSPFVTLTSNIAIGRHFHANLYSY